MTLRGLYAITPDALAADAAALLAAVRAALAGGARLIQYRDKRSNPAQRRTNLRALLPLCREFGAPLIVNDDARLAADAGADGVHLGLSDAPPAEARALLGPRALIGVTCGNSLERARAAQDGGASYVSFGRFFASRTKPQAPPAEPELLRRVRPQLHVPVCAIGGLTPDNAAPLIAAGADLIAAVGGVFDAPDIEAAARRYADLFVAPL